MPILNYTTKIDPAKSVAEIQAILSNHGARSIFTDYDEFRNVSAVGFALMVEGRPLNFRLPCKVDGVLAALKKERIQASFCTRDQARRVAWRIVKDWIEAQLALHQAGQAELDEIFMPYAIGEDGRTAYQLFRESHVRQLNAAPNNVVEGYFEAVNE